MYIKTPEGLILKAKAPKAVPPGDVVVIQYKPFKNKNNHHHNRKKKSRDPNAPKRASNAYMIFCKSRRPRLKAEFPDLPFGKIGAKLGEIWRDLRPDEKRPFEMQAAMDRQRYKKEMQEYPGDKRRKTKDALGTHPPGANTSTAPATAAAGGGGAVGGGGGDGAPQVNSQHQEQQATSTPLQYQRQGMPSQQQRRYF
uniref:HMG box domain-containing protein n=2 Tax=Lotharella globosa TaxID=91324 RepID=A0A6V3KBS6_9EUKA